MFLFSAGGFGRESELKLGGLRQVLRAAFIPWISSETENRRVPVHIATQPFQQPLPCVFLGHIPRQEMGLCYPSCGGTCPFVNFKRSAVVLASVLS